MARPTKPTHLKLVTGTQKKCRINKAEPKPPVGLPELPAGMSPGAVKAWGRVAPMLARMGVLTVVDGVALERLCETYATIIQCQDELTKLGGLSYDSAGPDKGPMLRAYPEVAILADAQRMFRTYLNDFGMTPASRSKVKSTLEQTDPLDEYFAG